MENKSESYKELMKHFEEMFYNQVLKFRNDVIVDGNLVREFKTWLNNRLLKVGKDAANSDIHTNIRGGITKNRKIKI